MATHSRKLRIFLFQLLHIKKCNGFQKLDSLPSINTLPLWSYYKQYYFLLLSESLPHQLLTMLKKIISLSFYVEPCCTYTKTNVSSLEIDVVKMPMASMMKELFIHVDMFMLKNL